MRIESRALASACLLLCVTNLVGCASNVKRTLDPAARQPEITRDLIVAVPQGEVDADFNPSTAGMAFGIIGAIIDSGVNQSRAKDAQGTVKVVRDAMPDYDFDQRALEASRQGLASLGWMNVGKTSFSKEISDAQMMKALDASSSKQVVLVSFRYALNGDFSSMWTNWTVSIVPTQAPAGKPPADRFKLANFAFNQAFGCTAALANPSKESETNAATWAQEQGKLVRASIENCLAQIGPVVKLSMEMTPQQREQAVKSGAKFSEPSINGKLIQQLPAGSLIVEPLTERWVVVLRDKVGA